jgi:hypothetical protein
VPDGVVPEFGQGPAAVRQADRCRRLVGEPAQGGLLLGADPGRRPTPVILAHPGHTPAVEGVQVEVDGVGMQGEKLADRRGIPPFGVQDDSFGAADLAAVGSGLEQLAELTQFSGGGPAGGHGAGHSSASQGEDTGNCTKD